MDEYKAQYYEDALQHYGIKGMRWGHKQNRKRARRSAAMEAQIKAIDKQKYDGNYVKEYIGGVVRAKTDPKAYGKGFRENARTSPTFGDRIRKATLYKTKYDLQDINRRSDKYRKQNLTKQKTKLDKKIAKIDNRLSKKDAKYLRKLNKKIIKAQAKKNPKQIKIDKLKNKQEVASRLANNQNKYVDAAKKVGKVGLATAGKINSAKKSIQKDLKKKRTNR